jgi:hypothetical protein
MKEENASKWCLLFKKAGIICMTENEAGAKCSTGKILSILLLVSNCHQEIITSVSTARSFWPVAA